MGFRLRKSIKVCPGLTLNLSKSGVSASIGVRGARVTVGEKGIRKTVGIPGTRLSYSDYKPNCVAHQRPEMKPGARPGNQAGKFVVVLFAVVVFALVYLAK